MGVSIDSASCLLRNSFPIRLAENGGHPKVCAASVKDDSRLPTLKALGNFIHAGRCRPLQAAGLKLRAARSTCSNLRTILCDTTVTLPTQILLLLYCLLLASLQGNSSSALGIPWVDETHSGGKHSACFKPEQRIELSPKLRPSRCIPKTCPRF